MDMLTGEYHHQIDEKGRIRIPAKLKEALGVSPMITRGSNGCLFVFSKEQLFERIWGYDYVGDSATVTVHIGRIREKIEDDPKAPRHIITVRGLGYKLEK